MGGDQKRIVGGMSFDNLTPDRVEELDSLWPDWVETLRETLEQLRDGEDSELRELADEALAEFDKWVATR